MGLLEKKGMDRRGRWRTRAVRGATKRATVQANRRHRHGIPDGGRFHPMFTGGDPAPPQ